MTQPTLIIYHANCSDGFTAAWAAQHLLPEPCELFAASYAKAGPTPEPHKDFTPGGLARAVAAIRASFVRLPDVTGRKVLMVDFCVGVAQLQELHEDAESFHVFDHHASAERTCEQFVFCTFDLSRSGAGLTWDLLADGKPRPQLVDYVEDRDLWRHKLPHTHAVNAYIATVERTLENWDRLAALDLESLRALGMGALAYRDAYVRSMLPEARRVHFLGHPDIPVVNAPPMGASDLVGALAKDALFAVGWSQCADEYYQYSLRSRGDFDVGALAETMGGGGHPGAAGFRTTTRPLHLTWARES